MLSDLRLWAYTEHFVSLPLKVGKSSYFFEFLCSMCKSRHYTELKLVQYLSSLRNNMTNARFTMSQVLSNISIFISLNARKKELAEDGIQRTVNLSYYFLKSVLFGGLNHKFSNGAH